MTLPKINQRGRIRIYLEREAPSFGCGWRTVDVVAGRKWAKLTCPYTGAKKKLRRAMWLSILKHTEKCGNILE